MIGHDGHFISGLETRNGVTRGAMDLGVKWIQTTATIDQKQNRKRQTVLAKVCDLLLRSVFHEHEVFLLQSAEHPRGILLQDQRVDRHEIDINLDDFRGAIRRRDKLAAVCWERGRLARINCSWARLRHHPQRQKEEEK